MSHPLERYVAYVGRHKTYLEKPELGTLPVSCTVLVPEFDTLSGIKHMIEYVSHALRTGAGINVHLDNFEPHPKPANKLASIRFELSLHHPEYQPTVSYQGWTTQLLEEPLLSGFQSDLKEADNLPQVVYVSDSMTEDNQSWYSDTLSLQHDLFHDSIEASLNKAFVAGLYGDHIIFNLSNLRPDGVPNKVGMVSSGAISFAFMLARAYEFGKHQTIASLLAFLSSFNAVLRRGGTYKNGAITTSLPIWHPLAKDYLETPKEQYPWLKQGLVLPKDYLQFSSLFDTMFAKVNNGGLWLEKSVIQVPSEANLEWLASDDLRQSVRLRSNVCREILIPSHSTCNLIHLNAGQIDQFSELPSALSYCTEVLCKLHALGPQDKSGYYKPAKEDRQIGVGIVGLSNLLARHQITYKELIVSLDRMLKLVSLKSIYKASLGQLELPKPNLDWRPADELSWWLIKAYVEAAKVARTYNMERAFCIAPTANSSFRYEDLEYFTTSPEISPPIARAIERVSETQTEEDIFFYHPQAETAMEVGWHWYRQLVDTWQTLMNATGLGHSISFNIWQDINEEFLYWFASSNVVSTYYRLNVDTSSLNKADQFANSGPPISCACAG